MDKTKNYDYYNREERAICSHLFRLLHENLDLGMNSPLGKFIQILLKNRLIIKEGEEEAKDLKFNNVRIYSEIAIIRDAYQNKKPNVNAFLDNIVKQVMAQEAIKVCRLYSELEPPINDPNRTHPKQIKQKAASLSFEFTQDELIVYGAVQEMFNAKPDLLITIDNLILIGEVKYTQKFDTAQMDRTEKLGAIWTNLLYEDLGFESKPKSIVFKLGAKKYNPEINWKQISTIANETYPALDRTRICINKGTELLRRYNL